MTLTENEQQLISDADNAVFDFAGSDECIIVDHRAEEESIFQDVAARLPDGVFQYEYDGEQFFSVTCGGVTETLELEFNPEDRYRALRFINAMMKPGYEMKIMRCTIGDDTHSFLLRPAAWWSEFAHAYPAKMQELFVDIDETMDFH